MKILIAPAAFKGSLSPEEAAQAMGEGVARALPEAEIVRLPLADGGDGTLHVFECAEFVRVFQARVEDPLGRPIEAPFGLLSDGETAVIETACASGLRLLKPEELDPLRTSTYGTGQLIRAAIDRGTHKILIGLGGSATVDGGAGMAQALGVRLRDRRGRDLPAGGGALAELAHIDLSPRDPRVAQMGVIALCDVESPLLGPQGARLYMAQKGATSEQIEQLERNLAHFALKIREELDKDVASLPGAGAAGGLGAGLAAFLDAKLVSGAQFILDFVGFERLLKECDLVLTGEGRVDEQTAQGKLIIKIAAWAKKHQKPCIVLAGSVKGDTSALYESGVTRIFSLVSDSTREREAMRDAQGRLRLLAQETMTQILLA